jgi:hypothetical protein
MQWLRMDPRHGEQCSYSEDVVTTVKNSASIVVTVQLQCLKRFFLLRGMVRVTVSQALRHCMHVYIVLETHKRSVSWGYKMAI